jgi:hypothetical protein
MRFPVNPRVRYETRFTRATTTEEGESLDRLQERLTERRGLTRDPTRPWTDRRRTMSRPVHEHAARRIFSQELATCPKVPRDRPVNGMDPRGIRFLYLCIALYGCMANLALPHIHMQIRGRGRGTHAPAGETARLPNGLTRHPGSVERAGARRSLNVRGRA